MAENYFQLLALPMKVELDQAELSRNFRQLQSQYHPDRFAAASSAEQLAAVQKSALINEAFDTLKSPVKRAAYLLRLRGVDNDAEHTMRPDPAFLMQQMQWREQLAELREESDPLAAASELIATIACESARVLTAFTEAYLAQDDETAAHLVDKLRFMDKLSSEARRAEDQLLGL